MSQTATNQYQTQQLMSANPAMLVFMLYDEAIRSLQKAVEAIAQNDIEGRWRANHKAIDIVSELALSLDMEKGGQIADKLYQLYRFILATLPQVDIRNDAKPAEDVIKLLEPLRDSWRELAKTDSAELAQARDDAAGHMVNASSENQAPAPEPAKPKAPQADTSSTVKISA